MSRRTGRLFFANPGPTNIPDSVLAAIHRPTQDFMDADFVAVVADCIAGLKRVLRTQHHVFMYTASGHGAWEATMMNMLSPGDTLLMLESGYFSDNWAVMGTKLGLQIEVMPSDRRTGVDMNALEATLKADAGHRIKAVCAVHNETSTGMVVPLDQVRAAMDAAKHPALLLSDTVSSLACLDFRMDDWGVDGVVGGSQKGLMLPVGLSFTGVSAKGFEAHKKATLPRHYFDWSVMLGRPFKSFMGTVPTQMFYGLQESLRLLEAEGLDALHARHTRLAGAVRSAVQTWTGNNGPQLYGLNPARLSDSVTAILMPDGHNADALRRVALEQFNISLGGGLGALGGKVFRIGHMGDLNEAMVLGTLGALELAMRRCGVPHGAGGVGAAMQSLAEAA